MAKNLQTAEAQGADGASNSAARDPESSSSQGLVARLKSSGLLGQGVRYVLVGGSTALLELGIFQLLYRVFGIAIVVANPIAVVISTTVNFLLNRSVTFKGASNPTRSLILYVCLFLVNMAITTGIISGLVGMGVDSVIAKLFSQACMVCWNFFLYRYVIFK